MVDSGSVRTVSVEELVSGAAVASDDWSGAGTDDALEETGTGEVNGSDVVGAVSAALDAISSASTGATGDKTIAPNNKNTTTEVAAFFIGLVMPWLKRAKFKYIRNELFSHRRLSGRGMALKLARR